MNLISINVNACRATTTYRNKKDGISPLLLNIDLILLKMKNLFEKVLSPANTIRLKIKTSLNTIKAPDYQMKINTSTSRIVLMQKQRLATINYFKTIQSKKLKPFLKCISEHCIN